MKILKLKTRKCRLLIGYFAFFRRQDFSAFTACSFVVAIDNENAVLSSFNYNMTIL